MKRKLSPRLFPSLVRRVLLSLLLLLALLMLIRGSALVDGNAGPGQVHESARARNPEFDYMHTRAEWEMLKERSYPSQRLLDGPTLSHHQSEAVAQLQKLEREALQPELSLAWTNIGPAHIPSTACGWGTEK